MRFIDIDTVHQTIVAILYILSIILAIGCTIISFLNKKHKRYMLFFMSLVLIASIQMFVLIEILYEKEWKVPVTDFTIRSAKQNMIYTLSLLGIILLLTAIYIAKSYMRYRQEISFNSIKEAFDDLPTAIAIINQQGIPVLVNKAMYDLVDTITGRDLQSFDDIIDIFSRETQDEKIKIDDRGGILLKTKDAVWQIDRRELILGSDRYQEITANEITVIYDLSQQLKAKDLDLKDQKNKQEKLLQEMIRSAKEEEILDLKIGIHAQFKEALLATRSYLRNPKERSPIDIWQDLLRKDGPDIRQEVSSRPLRIDASQVFGCNIILEGELPDDRSRILILTAMREAITNAVRHAGADEVKIRIYTDDAKIHVTVEDNADRNITNIKEGGGLTDLREKIERSGGELHIICHKSVKMILTLPIDDPEHLY